MTWEQKTSFVISKFKFKDERKDLVRLGRVAESSERFEDMCACVRELVRVAEKFKFEFTVEERNLVALAYKNVVGQRRASWRVLNDLQQSDPDPMFSEYKSQVEGELVLICEDILDLLENNLIKNHSKADDSKVFWLKMAGDYYRYLAEVQPTKGFDKRSSASYKSAYTLATQSLPPTHPVRLGVALNYSVCYFEVMKDKREACELAKTAFDQAIAKLDNLEESDYKDSTLIMQLIRDNLTLWTAGQGDH